MFNTTAEFEVVKHMKEKVCALSNSSHRLVLSCSATRAHVCDWLPG